MNGNSVDKNNALISAGCFGHKAESPGVYRTAPDPGVATLITANFQGDGGLGKLENPNDLVQHPSDVFFVTDPGYPPAPDSMTGVNHLNSISNDGRALAVDELPDSAHPNGIAITQDGSTPYVGVTSPILGTKPYINKYTVSATGTLSAGTSSPSSRIRPWLAGRTTIGRHGCRRQRQRLRRVASRHQRVQGGRHALRRRAVDPPSPRPTRPRTSGSGGPTARASSSRRRPARSSRPS